MAATQGPAPGTDFWAALGVGLEAVGEPDTDIPQDGPAAGATHGQTGAVGETAAERSAKPVKEAPPKAPAGAVSNGQAASPKQQPSSAKMVSTDKRVSTDRRASTDRASTDKRAAAGERVANAETAKSAGRSAAGPDSALPGAHAEWASLFSDWNEPPKGEIEEAPQASGGGEPEGRAEAGPATPESPAEETPGTRNVSTEPAPLAADPAWASAERIASEIESRLADTWLELLLQHTDGDRAMAYRVFHVLSGQHLFGALWADKRITEVHVRGTRVTVCGTRGVYETPGFHSLATAGRTIEVVESAQDKLGAVVTRVGDSVVVTRKHVVGPGTDALVASGAVTQEQLSQVRRALEHMRAVTLTGPAARIVMRAFTSLVPAGSRVFEGPHAALPAGCVAAASPLDADFVVGVRPGALAEEMAAAGQVGALIANPETQFRAAVRLVVTGRSAAPEKVTAD